MFTRHIKNHTAIVLIGEFNRLSNSNSLESRLCPKHKEAVTRNHVLLGRSPQMLSGAPPFEYVFEGCCDEAIDNELNFIQNFMANNSDNK